MASNAQKLIYTLKAVYEGGGEIKKLEADLRGLSQIEAHKTIAAGWKKTNEQFVQAKERMRELQREMRSTGDARLAKQYEAAARDAKKFGTLIDQQKRKLDQSRAALKKQGIALTSLDAEYDKLNRSAQKHGKVMSAMRVLGVRSFGDIEQEIHGLEQAYRDLVASGTRSRRELAVYHQRMKEQIGGLRQQTNGWTQQVGRLQNAWLGVAGLLASGVGFANLVKNTGENQKNLASLAKTAGMSVDQFEAYGYAVDKVGISQEKLADMSKDVKDKLGDFLETGGGEFKDFFDNVAEKAGITAEELIRMSGPDALIAVKKAMDDAGVSAENQVFYLEELANDASLLIPLLEKEGKAFKNLAGRGEELTDAISQMDRDSVKEVNTSIHDMTTAFSTLGTEIVATLAPAITFITDGLTKLATGLARMPDSIQYAFAGTGTVISLLASWHLGLKHVWTALQLGRAALLDFGGIAAQATSKISLLSRAMKILNKAFALLAAFEIGYMIGTWLNQFDLVQKAGIALASGLTKSFLKIKQAWAWASGGDVEAVKREIEQADKIYAEMFANVGKNAKEAGKVQKKVHKEVADSAKSSADKQKQVSIQALREMQQKYKEYASEVKRLQDEIAGRERSLYEELRDMARSGMSESDAWQDKKRQAEEYIEIAEKAAQAGETDKAVEYADKAKEMYKQLNTEVKEGNRVVISHKEALELAMKGVERAGKIGTEALKRQQDQVNEAMKALTEKAGFADLSKGMDEVMRKWLKNWQEMRDGTMKELDAVEKRIEKVIKDRHTNVYINVVEKKQTGGQVGVLGFAAGGTPVHAFKRLSSPLITKGSGLRDDVPALLSRKEYVQPERAVSYYGVDFMEAIRRLQFPKDLVKKFSLGGLVGSLGLPPLPVQMQTGGLVGAVAADSTAPINLTLNYSGSGSRTDANRMADMVIERLKTLYRRSS